MRGVTSRLWGSSSLGHSWPWNLHPGSGFSQLLLDLGFVHLSDPGLDLLVGFVGIFLVRALFESKILQIRDEFPSFLPTLRTSHPGTSIPVFLPSQGIRIPSKAAAASLPALPAHSQIHQPHLGTPGSEAASFAAWESPDSQRSAQTIPNGFSKAAPRHFLGSGVGIVFPRESFARPEPNVPWVRKASRGKYSRGFL